MKELKKQNKLNKKAKIEEWKNLDITLKKEILHEEKLNRQILQDMFNYNVHTEREIKELHNSKKDLIHQIKTNNKKTKDLKKQIKELNKVIKQLHNVDNNQLKKELRKNRRLNKIKDELLKKQEELINKQRELDDIILKHPVTNKNKKLETIKRNLKEIIAQKY